MIEPQEVGAVVTDIYGNEWVRVHKSGGPAPWHRVDWSSVIEPWSVWSAIQVKEDEDPGGVWAVYSYDYAPGIDSVHSTEEKAWKWQSKQHGTYYSIFLPFGMSLQEALEADHRAITEKEL